MKLNPVVALTTLLTITLAFSSFARAGNSTKWIPSTTNRRFFYDQNNVQRHNKYKDIFRVHFYDSIQKNYFYTVTSCTNGTVSGIDANGTITSPTQIIPPNSIASEIYFKYCPSNNNANENRPLTPVEIQTVIDSHESDVRAMELVREAILNSPSMR